MRIIAEQKIKKNRPTVSPEEFYEKVRKFLHANFLPSFKNGQLPYPGDGASDLESSVLADAFWAMNTEKGINCILKLQAIVLIIQFKQGRRIPESVKIEYMSKKPKHAVQITKHVSEFAESFEVYDPSLVELLEWCQDVVLGSSADMDILNFGKK